MRLVASLLVVTLGLMTRPVIAAPEPADPNEDARAAYDAGETAYRLGRFEQAAHEFERAYQLSALPAILYNIGLAYLRWYDTDPDIAHVRQAKVMFQNYLTELQNDPELGDQAEIEALIAECDQKIAAHGGEPETEPEPAVTPTDSGPDAGKPLRLAGAVTMGVGGALIVGGVIAGVAFGVSGSNLTRDLDDVYAQTLTCSGEACEPLEDSIATLRADGKQANSLALGLGLGLGGAGVVAVIAGAVLLVRSNKGKPSKLAASPTWLPSGVGLVVTGRF
jgi:tetratricopeptide (TPR) repeat protein